jgi:hypothetical protein
MQDPKVREEVLKHIGTQAKVQAAHMSLGTRAGRGRSDKAWRKILSDVDDTLSCSGGRFPAGNCSTDSYVLHMFCQSRATGCSVLSTAQQYMVTPAGTSFTAYFPHQPSKLYLCLGLLLLLVVMSQLQCECTLPFICSIYNTYNPLLLPLLAACY